MILRIPVVSESKYFIKFVGNSFFDLDQILSDYPLSFDRKFMIDASLKPVQTNSQEIKTYIPARVRNIFSRNAQPEDFGEQTENFQKEIELFKLDEEYWIEKHNNYEALEQQL